MFGNKVRVAVRDLTGFAADDGIGFDVDVGELVGAAMELLFGDGVGF